MISMAGTQWDQALAATLPLETQEALREGKGHGGAAMHR